MSIKWTIDNLVRQAANGAVTVAHWRCTAEDEGVTSAAIGVESFQPDPNDPGFVPFEQLTEEQVVGWVKDRMGEEAVAALEAKLTAEVDEKKQPTEVTGLPWAAAPEAPAPEAPTTE